MNMKLEMQRTPETVKLMNFVRRLGVISYLVSFLILRGPCLSFNLFILLFLSPAYDLQKSVS